MVKRFANHLSVLFTLIKCDKSSWLDVLIETFGSNSNMLVNNTNFNTKFTLFFQTCIILCTDKNKLQIKTSNISGAENTANTAKMEMSATYLPRN